MEVVEAVDGDEVPPLQFMHFLLVVVEEWSELELVGESWVDFFPFSMWRLRKFSGCGDADGVCSPLAPPPTTMSSSESCDLEEQFLHDTGRLTSEFAEVTPSSSSEAPS